MHSRFHVRALLLSTSRGAIELPRWLALDPAVGSPRRRRTSSLPVREGRDCLRRLEVPFHIYPGPNLVRPSGSRQPRHRHNSTRISFVRLAAGKYWRAGQRAGSRGEIHGRDRPTHVPLIFTTEGRTRGIGARDPDGLVETRSRWEVTTRAFKRLVIPLLVVLVTLPQAAAVEASGGWKKVAPIGLTLGYVAVVAGTEGTDGKAYFLRHCLHFKCVPSSTEVYNGVGNSWAGVAAVPRTYAKGYQVPFAATTGQRGAIFAIGVGGLLDASGVPQAGDLLFSYGSKTNVWTAKASLPTPSSMLAAVTGADGLIYALGGIADPTCSGTGVSSKIVQVYNPISNVWTTAPSMLTARDSFAAAVGSDHRIYAIGGEDDSNCSSGGPGQGDPLDSVEAYSLTTRSWINVAPFPLAGMMIGAVSGSDGRIYAMGGVFAAYNVTTNVWTTLATPPQGNLSGAVLTMTSVRLSSGVDAVLILDNICNNTPQGPSCSVQTFVYPT